MNDQTKAARHWRAPGAATWALRFLCLMTLAGQSALAEDVVGEALSQLTPQAQLALWRQRFPKPAQGSDFLDDKGFRDDLFRLQRIIQDPGRAMALLQGLEREVSGLIGPKVSQNVSPVQALEVALARREASHYFSTARIVPAGILDPKVFEGLPSQGFVFDDPGPGSNHGQYAHRLQWAMIMADFERNPQSWKSTPVELYMKILTEDLNRMEAAAQRGQADPPNIWAHLLDKPGFGDADGYRHPPKLTADLLSIDAEGGSKGPRNIARAVKAREDQFKPAEGGASVLQNLVRERLEKSGYLPLKGGPGEQKNLLLIHRYDLEEVLNGPDLKETRVALSRKKWNKPVTREADPVLESALAKYTHGLENRPSNVPEGKFQDEEIAAKARGERGSAQSAIRSLDSLTVIRPWISASRRGGFRDARDAPPPRPDEISAGVDNDGFRDAEEEAEGAPPPRPRSRMKGGSTNDNTPSRERREAVRK